MSHDQQTTTLGNTASVKFATLSDKALTAKVDTGATTSSLHATNIKMKGNQVSFTCEPLSNNVITVNAAGSQNVVTSDNGGEARPIVKLDIEINGISMRDVVFNLNDRAEMDLPVLVGENILSAGHFVVDISQDVKGDNQEIDQSHQGQDQSIDKHIQLSSLITQAELIIEQLTELTKNLK